MIRIIFVIVLHHYYLLFDINQCGEITS